MSSHHEVDTLNSGTGQKTLSAYIIGLVLCTILTLVAFALVDKHLLDPEGLYITLAALALVQLVVQVICFLRLNASAEGRWNLMPFLFTIFVVVVVVGGSLWIMYNLNYNMMH